MKFRSLVAAALLAVGLGQAAGAATVQTISFKLDRLSVYCMGGCNQYPSSQTHEFAGLRQGGSRLGQLYIDEAADGSTVELALSYGEDFSNTLFRHVLKRMDDGKYLFDSVSMVVPSWSISTVKWDGYSGSWRYYPDTYSVEQDTTISFDLAPVPLPTTAALLPLGIGALAVMRKRRRNAA